MSHPANASRIIEAYALKLATALQAQVWDSVAQLADHLAAAWAEGGHVFICGNGGSAANAIHWANDFLYAINPQGKKGLPMTALPANSAVLTCLGNDVGYERIFSTQLTTLARKGDTLIVLSGSGNSPNIIQALETARAMGLKTAALLGFSGGAARDKAEIVIHFPIDDMQIAEDLQLVAGHMLMRALRERGVI